MGSHHGGKRHSAPATAAASPMAKAAARGGTTLPQKNAAPGSNASTMAAAAPCTINAFSAGGALIPIAGRSPS
ncbi:MAG TPA: hypothetical protein DEP05_03505 [Betaproteobacteria bacterium]|nr:hypothetical protein [Betaproteobacteria bacterium]